MDQTVKTLTILSIMAGIVACAFPVAVIAEEQPTKAASSPPEERPSKKITAPGNTKPGENPSPVRTATEPVPAHLVRVPNERADTPAPVRTATEPVPPLSVRVPNERAYTPASAIHVVAEHRDRDRQFFPHRDFTHFDDRERTLWLAGRWTQNCFEGLCGFWWLAGGVLHFYAEPVYPYPIIVSDVVYVEPSAVMAAPVAVMPPPPPPSPIVIVAPSSQPVAPPQPSAPLPQRNQPVEADQPQNQSLQNLFK